MGGKNWLGTFLFAFVYLLGLPNGICCGLCHEDNRSAVYSYEAAEKAKAQPDKLEFAIFKVTGPLDPATAQKIQQWLVGKKGIDATTVKVSTSQKSMGFVMEKSISKDGLITELESGFPGFKFHSLKYN
jgi:hypothetical protein